MTSFVELTATGGKKTLVAVDDVSTVQEQDEGCSVTMKSGHGGTVEESLDQIKALLEGED